MLELSNPPNITTYMCSHTCYLVFVLGTFSDISFFVCFQTCNICMYEKVAVVTMSIEETVPRELKGEVSIQGQLFSQNIYFNIDLIVSLILNIICLICLLGWFS